MNRSFRAVLTAITFVPNSAPQIPYWKGIERRNVETANERIPPMSRLATAVRVKKILGGAGQRHGTGGRIEGVDGDHGDRGARES